MGLLGQLAAGLGIVNQTTDLAGPPASIMPPDRTAWRDDDAWTLDAVYRSVSLLAGSATQLSIDAQRAGVTMARRPLILEQPDRAGGRELEWFIEETMDSLPSRGNAYWLHTLHGAGAVLNVASVVAFQPMPSMATYGASKAFVNSFSEAVHEELRGTGVSCTSLCPGQVPTEWAEIASAQAALSRPVTGRSTLRTAARRSHAPTLASASIPFNKLILAFGNAVLMAFGSARNQLSVSSIAKRNSTRGLRGSATCASAKPCP